MTGHLQTIFAALSMAASLLVYTVNQQVRAEVIAMKIEMLDRLENLRQQNDRIYPRREHLEALERRLNNLELRDARSRQ